MNGKSVATCLLALAAMACTPGTGDDRPNILVISVDTLRTDRLTCYGGPQGNSPRVDQMAREGVRFASVQAVRGLTWPSLTTGCHIHQAAATVVVEGLADLKSRSSRLHDLQYECPAALLCHTVPDVVLVDTGEPVATSVHVLQMTESARRDLQRAGQSFAKLFKVIA